MPPLRISLASLLGLVAVIALGLAGMMSASSLWTTAAATLTLAMLLAAILAARLLGGTDRAFWSGFALFGWSYLLLVNWDWVGGQFGHDLTASLSEAAESIFPEVILPAPAPPQRPAVVAPVRIPPAEGEGLDRAPANPAPGPPVMSPSRYHQSVRERQIKLGNFVQIGRMFLSLAFAFLGGFIALTLAGRRETAPRTPAVSTALPADRTER